MSAKVDITSRTTYQMETIMEELIPLANQIKIKVQKDLFGRALR